MSELSTFDGRDNRREIIILLERLGSDQRRRLFLESLIPLSLKGFAGCPMKVTGAADCCAAYFMLVSICNEIGVSINEAARRLDRFVKKGLPKEPRRDPLVRALLDTRLGGE